MTEEPKVSLPTEELRQCPSCGARVAVMATTCLMCGVSLEEGEVEPEEDEEPSQKGLPGWARPLIVVALAVVFLAAGFYGLYMLMNVQLQDNLPPHPHRLLPVRRPRRLREHLRPP